MGLTQSTDKKNPENKKYSDEDIKNNINQLFNNNKLNAFSEASYSIKDLENIVVSDTPMVQPLQQNNQLGGGGNKKFNPQDARAFLNSSRAASGLFCF